MNYTAFCDSASGERKGNDKFAVGFAHRDGDRIVLDLLRWWAPPFSPSAVIGEIAALMAQYGITSISGDRYAPGFVAEQFRQHHVLYVPSPLDRSQIYLEALSLVNSGQCLLLDIPELLKEIRALERRRGSGGHDRIDHPPGGSDDRANAAFGAIVAAASQAMLGPLDPHLMQLNLNAPSPLAALTKAFYNTGTGTSLHDQAYGPTSGGIDDAYRRR
jgi:hypothetical protein